MAVTSNPTVTWGFMQLEVLESVELETLSLTGFGRHTGGEPLFGAEFVAVGTQNCPRACDAEKFKKEEGKGC